MREITIEVAHSAIKSGPLSLVRRTHTQHSEWAPFENTRASVQYYRDVYVDMRRYEKLRVVVRGYDGNLDVTYVDGAIVNLTVGSETYLPSEITTAMIRDLQTCIDAARTAFDGHKRG
jgi:phosphopantetheine adenylyltransferase